MGGYYGGLLARAGFETHFLARSDAAFIQQHGLRVDRPEQHGGAFALPAVRAYGEARDVPACDVVCLCVKTTQTLGIVDALPAMLKPDGVVLVMQNGLCPERVVAERVGAARVIGALCFLCSNKVGPGHVDFLDYGHIKLGELSQHGVSERLQDIAGDFQLAGIKAECCEDVRLARWQKLVWNVPYNGLSALLGVTTDVLMADAALRSRVVELMHEVRDAARAVDGAVITAAFIEQMLENTRKMRPYKTSMLLDKEAGRAMEVEAILGDPLRAGASAGLALPAMRAVYEGLVSSARS